MTSSLLTKDQTPPSAPAVKRSGKSRLLLWLNKLPKHKLPFNPSVAQAIKVEINDLESTSERLAGFIKQDPSLCLSLYQHTQAKVEAKEGDIQSLVHMIGLMGLRHIEKTLSPAPKPLQMAQGQQALYAASLFAAQLAKQLMPLKHGTVGERFFLPTLFFNAPLWLMWQAAPKVMSAIQNDMSAQAIPQRLVYRSRLGFQLHHLLKRSSQFLQLPKSTHQALSVDMSTDLSLWATIIRLPENKLRQWFEKNKAAKHVFYSSQTGIYLINQYVLALYFDLLGKHTQRFERLLCRHLYTTADELRDMVSKTAIGIKLPQVFDEEVLPHFRVRGLHRGEEDIIAPTQKKQSLSAVHTDPLALLKNVSTTDDALELAQKAMIKSALPKEIFIFRRSKNIESSLQIIHHAGLDDSIEGLTLKSTLCGQFFKKLLKQPIALLIKSNQLPAIQKQLPRPLLRFWSPRSFSIMSLYHKDQPLAIIACSSVGWNNSQHEEFKRVGKVLTKSLKQCVH